MKTVKTHVLRSRIVFTVFVLAVYVLGRLVPVYGAVESGAGGGTAARAMAVMLLSGSHAQNTLAALGVMPYINASLLVQIVAALKSSNSRAKVSKQRMDRWMLAVTMIFAGAMASVQALDMPFRASAGNLLFIRIQAAAELFLGAMLIFALCMLNEKHGIGASMPIILMNILSSLSGTLNRGHFLHYPTMIFICAVVIAVTFFMENKIIRIPLQRVSIHNIHADKNYIAYKLNPIGIMPVMFATAAFLVPRYIIRLIAWMFPGSREAAEIRSSMVMTRPLGIAVYLMIIILLTIMFSFIMLNPKESARQLQRNGDSIIGIYAGEKTTAYLVGTVWKLSLISGILQAACMCLSLVLSIRGAIPAVLAMVPSSAMILVSILCGMAQEISTYWRYDRYSFFL